MWTTKLIVICALAHARLTNAADSCTDRCGQALNTSYDCQCNTSCQNYGDCCIDYYELCLGPENSCKSRCGENYNSANPCHCNDVCGNYGNCCGDYDHYCVGSSGSCVGRCDDPFDGAQPCQCNTACKTHGDCCTDYDAECSGGGGVDPPPPSGGDLTTLADSLWANDVNRLEGADISFDIGKELSDYSLRIDESPNPLIGYVNEAALTGTWPTFLALLDNYNRFTGTADTIPAAEDAEIEAFLDAAFATQVMSITTTWMMDNGYFANEADFRAYVKNIWFTLYTRSSGPLDSSGFEHVFVGEIKNGKVSGYHNWMAFHQEEKIGKVNYYGYERQAAPNEILMQFNLDEGSTYWKELASIIIGASPEFELAIFTACFVQNPNLLSQFSMNGMAQKVQTWDYTGGYIGSTYFSV